MGSASKLQIRLACSSSDKNIVSHLGPCTSDPHDWECGPTWRYCNFVTVSSLEAAIQQGHVDTNHTFFTPKCSNVAEHCTGLQLAAQPSFAVLFGTSSWCCSNICWKHPFMGSNNSGSSKHLLQPLSAARGTWVILECQSQALMGFFADGIRYYP